MKNLVWSWLTYSGISEGMELNRVGWSHLDCRESEQLVCSSERPFTSIMCTYLSQVSPLQLILAMQG